MRKIGIHMFQWKLSDITKELQTIKDCGYDFVQISPIQGIKSGGFEWWKLYQPLGMRIIPSCIGNKQDLIQLCREAKKVGVEVIVDVVLRHTATSDNDCRVPHIDVDSILRDRKDFWTYAPDCQNYNDRWEVTNKSCGLPMLNYNNRDLQDIYKAFLHELRLIGVNGFRIDMGKHFALYEEGSNFWRYVFGDFKDMFIYAECIDCDKQTLDKYVAEGIDVFSNCDCSDKSHLVSFIMTHDTELTWHSTSNKTSDIIVNEWNWLLQNNKESHMLFYARPFDDLWKSERIKNININS